MRSLFLIGCFLLSMPNLAQEQVTIINNLNNDWRIFNDGKFENFLPSQNRKAVHFQVQPSFSNFFLQINSSEKFSLFLNGKLIVSLTNKKLRISIDSLSKRNNQLFFSIYVPRGVNETIISTTLIALKNTNTTNLYHRINSNQSDFFVIGSILLIIGFSLLFKTNPRLMLDYLSILKMVSLREREGVLSSNRITSAVNILFYVFVCYLVSFLILTWFPKTFNESYLNNIDYIFINTFSNWNVLAGIILILFVGKFMLIALFSFIFRLKGSLYLHFYNFIRVVILICIVITALTLSLYISHSHQDQFINICYWVILFISSGWLLVAYLKLLTNSTFSFSHLFFYLCVTEIFPLFIVIKFIS